MPQPNTQRTGRARYGVSMLAAVALTAGAVAELEAGIAGRDAPLAQAALRRCRELVPA
ncbi:hypothetical protein ABZU92_03375 [Micromonospora arida]|uniref:hypothetical protein n=1 Tax=Micromonospora arida TaxID=2203715 RepID=UPI0033AE7960